MKLSVYSLKNIIFQGSASLFSCKTSAGEITVLDNHETLITTITAGNIKIVDSENKEHFFPVASGFLEVKSENEVRCIVEQ
jgi:F-type H+-transporting ATPase subunit epsilon